MKTDELYEQWKRERGAGQVPAGFADRTMARVRQTGPAREPAGAAAGRLAWLAKAAAVAAALLLWAVRCAALLSTVLAAN